MGEVISLRDRRQAEQPKPRLLATSEYLNREPRSLEQYLRELHPNVVRGQGSIEPVSSLPCDCEPKDFAE